MSSLRRVGWASLIGNCLLVVTGGAVRLTGSGLGCPTWPRCHGSSFTPHGEMSLHSAIEFGNRTLTFLLVGIAIWTYVVARRSGRRDLTRLALLLGLAIPLQAVLGGITVLTDLNPWIVSLHLIASLVIISVAVLFLWRRCHPPVQRPVHRWLTLWLYAAGWVVLYLGTVVTGAGPNAGDEHARRNGLDILQVAQLHTDFVFLFVGLTLATALVVHAAGRPQPAHRAVVALLLVEVLQGGIGFVQYFAGLPSFVVGLHMLGAALTAAALTWAFLAVRGTDGLEPLPALA